MIFFSGGGGEWGAVGTGARESNFLTKNPNLNFFFFLGGRGLRVGVGVGIDGMTDEQAQTYLPLQLLRSWGHNNE